MKKILLFVCVLITVNTFSQINSPNGDNLFYYNGAADVTFRYLPRGNGGRAFVHADNNVLALNFQGDFTGGTSIGNNVYFNDGGNSYISSGNLGIGTSNPSAKLHINNGNYSYGAILANGDESPFSLYTKTFSTTPYTESFRLGLKYNNDENNGFISFYRGGSTDGGFLGFSTYGQERIRITEVGNIGIGTSTPDERLTVKGKIHTQEVRVDMAGPLVPDYVFANDYKLKSLEEVEDYIKQNNHLPEIPSAKEIEKNGLMLAEMNMILLKKMEEMTLYMIEMKKESIEMKKRIEQVEKKLRQ